MSELFKTLGVELPLLIAQIGNFVIVLIVLRLTVYKPLLKLMGERVERIEHGLKGAEEADRRLAEVEDIKSKKLADADEQALKVVGEAEGTAKTRAGQIVSGAEDKADYLLKEAAGVAKQKEAQELEAVHKKAADLIKSAIERTVELDPSKIDEQLIVQALKEVKQRTV